MTDPCTTPVRVLVAVQLEESTFTTWGCNRSPGGMTIRDSRELPVVCQAVAMPVA